MDAREKLVEQAISHFSYGVSHDIFSEPVTTYAKLAIDSLEKQIPKKPKNTKCQLCNHYIPMVVRDRKMRFCPFCGQNIDWSGDE